MVVVVVMGVVSVIVCEPSSLLTVVEVEVPLDCEVVAPDVIVLESTPSPALENEEGRNTKEHTNNAENNRTATDIRKCVWGFGNSFFCGIIIWHFIIYSASPGKKGQTPRSVISITAKTRPEPGST